MNQIESDPKMSRQFDKIVDYLSNLDPEQQDKVVSVVSKIDQPQGEHTEGKETRYYDYGGDRPQEISKSHFIKRKLMTILPASIVGAVMGIAMAGGTSASDVLEMALGMAASAGGLSAGLISTVGRQKVDVPDEESDEPVSESYRKLKKVIRLTESDLARIVKRVLNEQGGKTPFDPDLDLKMSGPAENNSLEGFKLTNISFPKGNLTGQYRDAETGDKPKTIFGGIANSASFQTWVDSGQVDLSNDKEVKKFFGKESTGARLRKDKEMITYADKTCKGLLGVPAPDTCVVTVQLSDGTKYNCWNDGCKKQ